MSLLLRRCWLCGLLLAGAAAWVPGSAWTADELANFAAEEAISVKYEVAALRQDKKSAEGKITRADQVMQSVPPRMKTTQASHDKALAEKKAADDVVAEKEAANQAAKAKADQSQTEEDKLLAKKAADELSAAQRTAQQKAGAVASLVSSLERDQQQLDQAQVDKAAAQESIPKFEAAAIAAEERAAVLRQKALEEDRQHASRQQPLGVSSRIDERISAALAEAKIPASPRAEDGEFLRRATLDIAGRVPSYEEVVAFLEDKDPNKRSAAIDRLLSGDEYGRTFGTIFCDLSTDRATSTVEGTSSHFSGWLIESLNLNRRWDRVVTDMLSAEGTNVREPGGIFLVSYLTNSQPDPALIVAGAGELFLGVQIKCAQCHDHPFIEEWSQDDFWGLAALFSRVRLKGATNAQFEYLLTDEDVADEKELLRAPSIKYPPPLPGGKIDIPDPTDPAKILRTVSARWLDGTKPQLPEKGFYRTDFARWLTSKENPYFARATVNRLWAHFFARGLIHPVASMDPGNKPSHPEVLELLAEEFKSSGYDLKHLVRCIVNTQTYQRTSRPLEANAEDDKLYSHMAIKTLQADALVDALTVAIGRTPVTGDQRRTAKNLFATRLPDGDAERFTHSIPQILRIMNGREYNDAATAIQKATTGKEANEAIAGLYLSALSRPPTDRELEMMKQYVAQAASPRDGYADVYWVLLNSAEFLVNH